MTQRCAPRLVAAVAVISLGAWASAALADTASAWRVSATPMLQLSAAHQRYGDYLGGQSASQRLAELRLDATLEGFGGTAVLKPRLRALDLDTTLPGLARPRRASLTEAYVNVDLSSATRLTLGKRFLGWGMGLLYSPSNRLFPDNGSASPRQEIDGKWMAMLSSSLSNGLQTTVLLADPYVQETPALDTSGPFGLARIDHLARTSEELTWGLLVGAGGGLRPYLGGYGQMGWGDAWTLGAEWSASRGYAKPSALGTGLRADAKRLRGDAALVLRRGLRSGGEWGIELVHNGFHQSDAEQANPGVAVFPPAATTQTRYAARSPLAEKHYLNLQLTLTELGGNKRWSLFARHLEAIQGHGRIDFAELAYSPHDRVTLYLGVTQSAGRAGSTLVRTLERAAYVTLDLHL